MNILQNSQRAAYSIRSLRSASTQAAQAFQVAENVTTEARPYSEIPRPGKLEFIRAFMPGGEFHNASIVDFAAAMRKRYGDIFIMPGVFGRTDWVTTFSPQDMAMVFRNEGNWPKRETFASLTYFRTHKRPDVYGDMLGLVSAQSENWGKMRSALNPIFMQPKGLKSYYEPLSDINNEFIERIKEVRDSKTLEVPENFMEEISRLIFDSLSLVAFDRQMGLLRKNRDNPDALKLFKQSKQALRYVFELDVQPSMWKVFPTPTYRKMMRLLDESLTVAQKLLKETQDTLEKRRLAGETINSNSMLERMMEVDTKLAVIMSLDILFAGIDATSNLLSAVLLCLAKNPEKQAKLRKELLKIMPTKDTALNEESMKDMPYLRAVIKEALRYYPNGLGNMRECPTDVTLSGYNVPKNTTIVLGSNILFQDNSYYPQADKFLPERWLRDAETGKKTPMNAFTYLPFGFGPRMCIGKRLVDLEVETSVAKVIRNFQVEFNYDASRPYKTFFIMEAAIPFRFKFTDLDY
ncbi:probable cytochrome P450 12d1 proximal, mitochondrial isoform X1 [Drosophila serrata]|uniref:probable cytochrome P450 12d1 proximal, mitochondrial isoform X1 n=1 Tax=Drosophila serrata TaxID=7274 RepID=UPI000A1D2172|nr:probable cytochrome P450 12d1 proximal, mitochondrial isoform X1 [Drosophila serrata]